MRTRDSQPGRGVPAGTYINAFARGLEVIRAFGQHDPEMTLSQVAAKTGLSRANARRILLTLEHLGYVAQSERRFRLTARILDLGYAYLSSQSLSTLAQPILEDLVSRVRQRANIAVLDGEEIIYIARVATKGDHDAYPLVNIGRRFPAFATAMGRVLLGALPQAELDRFFRGATFPKLTQRTTTQPGRLREIVLRDHAQGWSFVRQELSDLSTSLGVPLHGGDGSVIAALSIGWFPGTPAEDEERCREALPQLLQAAGEIDRAVRLGRYDRSALH